MTTAKRPDHASNTHQPIEWIECHIKKWQTNEWQQCFKYSVKCFVCFVFLFFLHFFFFVLSSATCEVKSKKSMNKQNWHSVGINFNSRNIFIVTWIAWWRKWTSFFYWPQITISTQMLNILYPESRTHHRTIIANDDDDDLLIYFVGHYHDQKKP